MNHPNPTVCQDFSLNCDTFKCKGNNLQQFETTKVTFDFTVFFPLKSEKPITCLVFEVVTRVTNQIFMGAHATPGHQSDPAPGSEMWK